MPDTNNNFDEDYIALTAPAPNALPQLTDAEMKYINRGYWQYEPVELQLR